MKALFLSTALALSTPALAHDWYPWECCHDQDCDRISMTRLEATSEGWRVPTGEIIPYGDTRIRKTPPDQEGAHWCRIMERGEAYQQTLCLFLPPMGM